jgi:hypothetical protein
MDIQILLTFSISWVQDFTFVFIRLLTFIYLLHYIMPAVWLATHCILSVLTGPTVDTKTGGFKIPDSQPV